MAGKLKGLFGGDKSESKSETKATDQRQTVQDAALGVTSSGNSSSTTTGTAPFSGLYNKQGGDISYNESGSINLQKSKDAIINSGSGNVLRDVKVGKGGALTIGLDNSGLQTALSGQTNILSEVLSAAVGDMKKIASSENTTTVVKEVSNGASVQDIQKAVGSSMGSLSEAIAGAMSGLQESMAGLMNNLGSLGGGQGAGAGQGTAAGAGSGTQEKPATNYTWLYVAGLAGVAWYMWGRK